MELRRYAGILLRRWWLAAALVAVVLVVSLVTYRAPPPVYRASLRFAIGIEGSEPVSAVSGEGRSDAWLASEYLADDLAEVLKGGDFRHRVSRAVGSELPAGSIFASREHRILSVSIDGPEPERLRQVAEAMGAVVQEQGAGYFPQLQGVGAQAVLIDGPSISPVGRSLTQKLDLPLRLLIALVAGVALAFLWDYLDDTVRNRSELESLGVAVVGEIPQRRRRLWHR